MLRSFISYQVSHKMSTRIATLFIFCFTVSISSFITEATVPPSARFQYVNEGDFGDYIVEYDANYRPLDPFNNPFQLCFYNTTPNAFTLALRMGTVRSESLMRWVWEANRAKPVRENATLTFGEDGNLVLADADGKIAWQTNTANKGVVGFKLLPNGNMVLHDAKDNFIWQSFDSPTDTLLVGQSLKRNGKLVSRASETQNVDGAYSLVMETTTLTMYYKTLNSLRPLPYFSFADLISTTKGPLNLVTFNSDLSLSYEGFNSSYGGTLSLKRAKYNSTLSYLRLGIDGNIRFNTYEFDADYSAWEVTYTLFSRIGYETECQLPSRCGDLGLCEDDQCVACPLPSGLAGWSKDCKPPKLTSCNAKDFKYYKIEGVDHFLSKYTRGDVTQEASCGNKCTKDCKCLGYFYNKASSRCWIAYDLKTLTKVANSTHVGYIKAPNM